LARVKAVDSRQVASYESGDKSPHSKQQNETVLYDDPNLTDKF
jgi:hypothetical protein